MQFPHTAGASSKPGTLNLSSFSFVSSAKSGSSNNDPLGTCIGVNNTCNGFCRAIPLPCLHTKSVLCPSYPCFSYTSIWLYSVQMRHYLALFTQPRPGLDVVYPFVFGAVVGGAESICSAGTGAFDFRIAHGSAQMSASIILHQQQSVAHVGGGVVWNGMKCNGSSRRGLGGKGFAATLPLLVYMVCVGQTNKERKTLSKS